MFPALTQFQAYRYAGQAIRNSAEDVSLGYAYSAGRAVDQVSGVVSGGAKALKYAAIAALVIGGTFAAASLIKAVK